MKENQLEGRLKGACDNETLSLWEADHISPASEIDSFVKSNGKVLWTKDATYWWVSSTDLEIMIHKDNTVLLVKGDLEDKIFYHTNKNNSESGILWMFTDKTAPKTYWMSNGDSIDMSEIIKIALEMLRRPYIQ